MVLCDTTNMDAECAVVCKKYVVQSQLRSVHATNMSCQI